jgi:trimethylamine--corrinoid protein Co-methyltransferase
MDGVVMPAASMRPISYKLEGGFSTQDMDRLWEGALRLIKNVGLRVPHDGIRRCLAEFDGVEIKNDIVTFRAELVEKARAAQDYSDWPSNLGPANPNVIAGAYVKNVLDPESNEIRPALVKDLIDFTKLCDAYGFYGPPCVKPNDVPLELQRILMYKISYEYSRAHAHGILDVAGWLNPNDARYGKEMCDAAGKDFRLDLWIVSPFVAPSEDLAILYEFRYEPVYMNVSTMPVTGTTSPINMIDSYVQSIAELFSAMTLVYLLNERKSKKGKIRCVVADNIRAYPFDMRYGAFVYGSAEDCIGTFYQAQLNRYFGIPLVAKSLLTTGKRVDAHAAGEKAAHTMAAVLAGAYVFSNAGLLCVDETYSVQQLLIDWEIVQFCSRVMRGYDFDENLSSLPEIEQIGHSGNHLESTRTLENFRRCLWDPEIFIHPTLVQWQQRGSREPAQIAWEIARKKIQDHTYRADKEVRRELDKIYARAQKDLLG